MKRLLGELVTFKSTNGLALDGILYRNDINTTTIVHVHGSFGNFYQNQFVRIMAERYVDAGVNFLSFNTASHDGFGEGYRNQKDFEYVGGAIADFDECVGDIAGAIGFVSRFSDRIVLQGHSLGCDRVLHFLIQSGAGHDCILLAPCDSYQLQVNWIAPESVEEQIVRLRATPPIDPSFDWLPSKEYGVRQGTEWTYPIPITRKALLSIMLGPPYSLFRIEKPADFVLAQRALVYVGGTDALQVWPNDVMFKYFRERIGGVTEVFVQSGDHMLATCEHMVMDRIVNWLHNR